MAGAGVLAGFATRWVVKGLAVVLFAAAFALVVVFADPVEPAYAYPALALAGVAGFAAIVRRGVGPVVFAVAFVLALLPTAGVAHRLGRDERATFGSCTVPVAAFFVESGAAGWTEYTPRGNPVTGEIAVVSQTTDFVIDGPTVVCDRLAGQRLATSLASVLAGVLLLLTAPRGPAAEFRVRGLR